MELFLGSLLSFLLLYKYVALFVVAFLAAFLIPLPSSSALVAAGAFASQGYFSLPLVLLVALIGNIGGDLAGFFLARLYGKEMLIRVGFKKMLVSKRYLSVEKVMDDFSYSFILVSRFLTQVGPAVNILSGLAKVTYKRFIAVDIVGEILYVLLYGLTGYFLGYQWKDNASFFALAGAVIVSFGVILGLIEYGIFRAKKIK